MKQGPESIVEARRVIPARLTTYVDAEHDTKHEAENERSPEIPVPV